jgi:hypothetical protein
MKLSIISISAITLMPGVTLAFAPSTTNININTSTSTSLKAQADTNANTNTSRRQILQSIPALAFFTASTAALTITTLTPQPANAITNGNDGNLPDLPPDARKSYLQYRIPLQISADYYLFDLRSKLADIDEWGDINQLFQVNNNNGMGQPSKVERDFINPMRILTLSMPPDEADEMRAAQFRFEKAMLKISKSVQGIRRDLPVEIDPKLVVNASAGWDDGRVALNEFFVILNGVTGFNELKTIPPRGPDQFKEYGRSQRKYNELIKKTKLCQNRGGPALSTAWGYLQTTQLLQDSCGIPDLDEYFNQ